VNLDAIFAPAQEPLAQFEVSFAEILHSQIPLAEQVVRYISALKGKRMRPLMVFLSSQLHGAVNQKSIGAAIVVELLHTATLVHDDVVDNSVLRRGKPTVNHLWDNRISVLVGDLLFSRTLTAVLDLHDQAALGILSETANRITEGELMQLERGQEYTLEEADYFDLVAKKTAALFSASCELGALAVTADAGARQRMKLFGEHLGIAFQIKDDLLDYMGEIDKLGKPVGNDIRENKITLPLIYALNQADVKTRDAILQLLQAKEIGEDQIQTIVQFVRNAGGLDYAQSVAGRLAQQANEILAVYPDSESKYALTQLVQFSIQREI